MFHQPMELDEVEELAEVLGRRPWRVGDPGRAKNEAGLARGPECELEVGARVSLVEVTEDLIARRLEGRCDEECTLPAELLQDSPVLDEMLDLGGRVPAHRWMTSVQGAGDGERVGAPH